MDTRDFFVRYAKSPLGIGTAFAALGLGVFAFTSAGPLAAVAVLLLTPAISMGVALTTGLASKAAVTEGEREKGQQARTRMAAAAEARKSLAALRLPPGPVATARDLVTLEAGRLIETFSVEGTWDPEAARAVEEALELVDAWQRSPTPLPFQKPRHGQPRPCVRRPP